MDKELLKYEAALGVDITRDGYMRNISYSIQCSDPIYNANLYSVLNGPTEQGDEQLFKMMGLVVGHIIGDYKEKGEQPKAEELSQILADYMRIGFDMRKNMSLEEVVYEPPKNPEK